jgi:hypothetical protein
MFLDDRVELTTINAALFSGAVVRRLLNIDSIAVLQNLRQYLPE